VSLKEIRALAVKRLELSKLPEEIVLRIRDYVFKEDSRGRRCLFINFATKAGETVTMKYTPIHLADLADSLEQLGYDSLLPLEKWHLWRAVRYRIGNPRLIPIKKVK